MFTLLSFVPAMFLAAAAKESADCVMLAWGALLIFEAAQRLNKPKTTRK